MSYTAQPVGFLAETIQRIYDYANEPSDNPKWTSDKLFNLIRGSWARAMNDVNTLGKDPIVVRYDIPVTNSQKTYLLPCNVGQILSFGKVEPQTGEFYEVVLPRSRLNPCGGGVLFEGNLVRFEPSWPSSETLRILYIPSGDFVCHLGTFAASDTGVSATKFPISLTPTEGYFDRRPNGYIGSVVRLLSCVDGSNNAVNPSGYGYFPIQERPIVSVAGTTRLATVDPAFDFDPASLTGGTITYEIVPFLGQLFQEAVAWDVAAIIHGTEGRPNDKRDAWNNKAQQMRTIRSNLSGYNARTGSLLRGDIPGTGRYGWVAGL